MKHKILCVLLSIIIVCVSLTACFGKKVNTDTSAAQTSDFDIKCDAEFATAKINGDYAIVNFINPSLDTADITVVAYSLKQGKETARLKLGNGNWQVGPLDNGFFVVDEANLTVKLYDFSGKETAAYNIDTADKLISTSYVSSDGKYFMYIASNTCEVYICEMKSGKSYVTGKAMNRVESLAYADDSFYIYNGSSGLLKVSVKDKQLITVFDDSRLTLVTEYGGSSTGDNMEFLYIDAARSDTVKKIRYQTVDEFVIKTIPFGIVTLASDAQGDILRLYDKKTNALREINLGKSYVDCAADDGNTLLVSCRNGENDYNFRVYDINGITEKPLQSFTEQAPEIPTQPEAIVSDTPDETPVKESTSTAHMIKGVPILAQRPEYPTGCESVSAVMALKYKGHNITVAKFIDNYLEKSSEFTYENGIKYGPDPKEYFIGDPRYTGGYGCFAPVIKNAVTDYLGNQTAVADASGSEMDTLCRKYIVNNVPVMVWVTISMIDTYSSAKWQLKSGETFYWPANEHCMLLIGFDENYYYFNDPYAGKQVKYSKEIAEKRYSELGKQALAVIG